MKVFQFAVVLLIVCISCAEALRCIRCVPPRFGAKCVEEVETCSSPSEVCMRADFRLISTIIRRCIHPDEAFPLKNNPYTDRFTCSTDLCN